MKIDFLPRTNYTNLQTTAQNLKCEVDNLKIFYFNGNQYAARKELDRLKTATARLSERIYTASQNASSACFALLATLQEDVNFMRSPLLKIELIGGSR